MASSGSNSQQGGRSPCVSVIIPVYNGARTIDRALKSVFDQTFSDYEIVICDDGSTDDTPAILAKHGDRIRVVRQPNRGLPAARNAAVDARRCFIRVLKYNPRHAKSYLRIARTFLPAPIRQALGGKASRSRPIQ